MKCLGHIFEKKNLENYLVQHDCCPLCQIHIRKPLKNLIPATELPTDSNSSDLVSTTDGEHGDPTTVLFTHSNDREKKIDEYLDDIRDKVEAFIAEDEDENLMCLTVDVRMAHERKPITIVCVIDVSGSMSSTVGKGEGSKAFTRLDLVKHVLNVLISSLDSSDRLALITFTNTTSVVLKLCEMNEENKRIAQQEVKKMKPFSNTYTAPAISEAYRMLKESYSNPHSINSIILLTDGQDTEGEEELHKNFSQIITNTVK